MFKQTNKKLEFYKKGGEQLGCRLWFLFW